MYSAQNQLDSNKEINRLVEQKWNLMCKEANKMGRKCFNAKGYSLDGYLFNGNILTLKLSNTTYKQYVATFRNSRILNSYKNQHFPKLLSLFGSIITTDNYLVFGNSSNSTRSSGQFSAPGGTVQKTSRITSAHLISEFKREVVEETGIPSNLIVNVCVKSIVIKNNTNNTPRLVLLAKTLLKKDEVKKYFSRSDKEYSELVFVKNNSQKVKKFAQHPKSNWTIKVVRDILSFSS